MAKLFGFGDFGVSSGFGRICNETFVRLVQRGHQAVTAGLYYTGTPHNYPFWIYPLAGQNIWQRTTEIINGVPDIDVIISVQDFPYHVSLFRDCPIDWSNKKFLFITPIDGEPIDAEWTGMTKAMMESNGVQTAGLIISEFGVEAMRRAGVKTTHLPPGVNTNEFKPAGYQERAELRAKVGLAPDAYVIGMFAMNQGRKNIPATVEGFWEFARDKPNAYLYLDMDDASPAGWNIQRQLMGPLGIPKDRVIMRSQVLAQLPGLRERYCINDVHSLLSFREGFGLPIIEAMACGLANYALDWCSGPELLSGGRGVLVKRQTVGLSGMTIGTWGGAKDAYPNMADYIEKLNWLYYNPEERLAIAKRGYDYAITRTWDRTTDILEKAILEVIGGAVSNSASIWESYRNPEVRGGAAPDPIASVIPSRDNPDGRLLEGVQSGGNNGQRADASIPQSEELGIRSELQPGSEDGAGGIPLLREQ